MKTLLLLSVILLGACAAPPPAPRSTAAESTSSRVKSDSAATKTYNEEELRATGQTDVGEQLERRDPAISSRRR